MQNLHLLEFLAGAMCSIITAWGFRITLGQPIIENGVLETEKLLLKTQVSEDFV